MDLKKNPGMTRYRKTIAFREKVMNFFTVKLESLADERKARSATFREFHISGETLDKMIAMKVVKKPGSRILPRDEKRNWRERHKDMAVRMVEVGGGEMLENPGDYAEALVRQGATVLKGLGEYNADQSPGTLVAILNHVNNFPAEFKAEFFGESLTGNQERVLPAAAEGADGPAVPGK